MSRSMMKKIILWVLTLSVALGIFMFSEQSAEQSSAISGAVTQGLLGSLFSFFELTEDQQETIHIVIRALAHVVSFALLGFFDSLLVQSYRLRYWLPISFGSCAAYAVFDEYHQLWLCAGRAFEWSDIVKDCIGALIGIGLSVVACRVMIRYRVRKQNQKEGC